MSKKKQKDQRRRNVGKRRWMGRNTITPPDDQAARMGTMDPSNKPILDVELGSPLPFKTNINFVPGMEGYEELASIPDPKMRNNFASEVAHLGRMIQERELKKEERARRQHIIDNLDHLKLTDDKEYVSTMERVIAARTTAKRFVFDDEASLHLGSFIRDYMDLWFDQRQFATPPYPQTYIQMNIDAVLRGIGAPTSVSRHNFRDGLKDYEIAYLIDGKMACSMVRAKSNEGRLPLGAVGIFSYEVERGTCTCRPIFSGRPMQEGDDRDHISRGILLLGSSYNMFADNSLDVRIMTFLHDVRIHFNMDPKRFEVLSEKQRKDQEWDLIFAAAGEYRVMLAALFLLNQQKHIEVVHVPNSSGLIGGKRKVFHQHHKISVHVKQLHTLRRSLGRTRTTPLAEHDVKGHWRNLRLRIGCDHQWMDLSDRGEGGHLRYACARCNGMKTTVKPHKRGDNQVGTTSQNYVVES